jgi:transcriptional regulator with XRE-family HTH domain
MNRLELRQWRSRRHLTQTSLAELLGVCQNTAWRWESGESTVPPFLPLALDRLDELHDWRSDRSAEAGMLAAMQRRIADLQRQIGAGPASM